jgi:hypothetical protein
MKKMRKLYIAPLIAVALVSSKTGWKPLFNGKTLEPDWYIAGDKSYWKVDPIDSAIVGASTNNTPYTMVFSNKKDYDQFTIKYQYRLKAGCSGFFFRSQNTTSQELVAGTQVEAKFESGSNKEVGSLYVHPSPGWVAQHPATYSARVAKPADQYQQVTLTVKRPYYYVNVNGFQTVGETDDAEIALGAKKAWDYTGNPLAQNPGQFGLQIHGGQPQMDVRFKNIMILEGCGDATSKNYDGAFVTGLSKHPAIYQDNNSCNPVDINESAAEKLSGYIGKVNLNGKNLVLNITYPGSHTLEIVSLKGKVVFSGSAPTAFEYHISGPRESGVYIARIKADNHVASHRILIP